MTRLLAAVFLAGYAAVHARAELPPLPRPATSFGAALVSGQVYLYGGNIGKAHEFHTDSIKGDFYACSLEGGSSWSNLAGGPALLSPALVGFQGAIWRIGGLNARNAKGEPNDLHSTSDFSRFDPQRLSWESLPPLPHPRSSHDAAILDDILYIGGGWSLDGPGNEEWCRSIAYLDLKKFAAGWKEAPQPFQRRALAVAAYHRRIWFLGGMSDDNQPSNEVDWYEPATQKWGHGPRLPESPMSGFGIAACVQDGTLYASPLSGDILALKLDESGWEKVATLQAPRFFHRLLPAGGGRLLAIGGSNRQQQLPDSEWIELTASGSQLPASTVGACWPQWRGPNRDGVSTEIAWRSDWSSAPPALLWKATVGAGMSSPVVANGKVLFHGNDGEGLDTIRALEATTGRELWRDSFPCISKPHEMSIVPPGPCATPTIDPVAGSVFALSREGELRCLELVSGKLIWRKNLVADLGGKRPVYGYAQSPLLCDGRVILDVGCAAGESHSTVALDAASGEVVWQTGSGEAGYSSARAFRSEGRQVIAIFKGERLELLDGSNGQVLCSFSTTARDFSNASTPVFVGRRVFVGNTGFDAPVLLDWKWGETEMRPIWNQKQLALLFNSPISKDGCLFAFNEKRRDHDEFVCVDETSGVARWVSDAIPTGTFLLAGDRWIFLTRAGELINAFATPDGLQPSGRFQAVTGKCYATPALASGLLYVRNNAGDVAAFDLR